MIEESQVQFLTSRAKRRDDGLGVVTQRTPQGRMQLGESGRPGRVGCHRFSLVDHELRGRHPAADRSASALRNTTASSKFDLPTPLAPAMHVNGPKLTSTSTRFLKPVTRNRVSMVQNRKAGGPTRCNIAPTSFGARPDWLPSGPAPTKKTHGNVQTPGAD